MPFCRYHILLGPDSYDRKGATYIINFGMRDAAPVDDVEKYGPDISSIIDYISNVLFQNPILVTAYSC